MEHIVDFKNKQRRLKDCISQFPVRVCGSNSFRRQWFDDIKHILEEGGFTDGATSYMIDYVRLEDEVLTNIDKFESICNSLNSIMKFFHEFDNEVQLRTHPTTIPLVEDGIISEGELDWLAGVYDGMVYRFRANARLMEDILDDASDCAYTRKYLDGTDQQRRFHHIVPYEHYIEKIKREYTAPLASPKETSSNEEEDTNKRTLPKELDNKIAKKYFKRAIKLKVMDENYHWLIEKESLALFACEMSARLKLSHRHYPDGRAYVSWLPFEKLFGVKGLRGNLNDINKTGKIPNGKKLIDEIFSV